MTDDQEKSVVLVIGGTGTQGSSVARALLRRYSTVRILTRRPNSTTAQELQKLGAKVCVGDLEDKESISRAINGVNMIFLVTIHDPISGDWRDELRQGMNFIETLEENIVVKGGDEKPLVVFSTLPSLSGLVNDENVDFLTEYKPKIKIEERLRESKLIDSLFVSPGYYAENFRNIWPPSRKYVWFGPLEFWWLLHPQKLFHSIVMERDFGRAVVALMERKSELLDRNKDPIYLSTEFLTLDKELRIMGKAIGEDIQHNPLSGQELSVLPKKLRVLVEFYSAVEEPKEVMETLRKDQKLTLELLGNEFDSFEDWCLKNKEALRAGNRGLSTFRNTVKATASVKKNWPYLLVVAVAVVGGCVLSVKNRK